MRVLNPPAFIVALTAIIIISCGKTAHIASSELASDSTVLSGKWNIISDSQFVGVGLGNHLVMYYGNPSDYFDFGTGGNLIVEENGAQTILKYTLYPDSKILISTFGLILNGVPDTSTITGLTQNTATITSTFYPTPGGIFGRKVILSR